jgi:dihydroneopterin aldolase
MIDDTALAFERPEVRAEATHLGDPVDRISVRDFTKEVEIGAFQSERGAIQRIRFLVVVEVSPSDAAHSDDVDLVLSYVAITEAIEEQLANERLNLLETLAERVAESILTHPRTMRVFVRIEKLDRIPGTLGVEIVRSKEFLNATGVREQKQRTVTVVQVLPKVVFLSNEVLHSNMLSAWLDAVAAHDEPAIICMEQAIEMAPSTDNALVDRRIGLLSIAQNAWVLAAKDARCFVVDSRTEMDWAMKNGQLSVWAPTKMVLDAVHKPEAGPNEPLELAQWFAKEFAADHITILGQYNNVVTSERVMIVSNPSDL